MRRSIALVALVVLPLSGGALAGCAEQQPAVPAVSATPQASAVAGSSAPPSASAVPVPTPSAGGLVQLTVHSGRPPAGVRRGPAWELVSSPTAASTSVQITWTDTPSPGCGAVRDVWVRETATSVVLDLVRSARATGIMCPALLVPRRAEVPLPSPLGSRTLQQDAASAGVQPGVGATPGTAG